ncbi:MAG TPA: CDP-diacylglycerol--glycerol-3-phosphate 3-phosphatidyltransferase [Candidatus Krumholzibacterium sp.]|nr:CDP-diacylglycerol--glycerol-3-phosphate 3-phosphatidyltransferase [Candidatus Krumholzibacterium sp.]
MVSRRDLTVPNALTLLRIVMAVAAAFIIRHPESRSVAAVMLIVASVLDYFDGWYARKFHQKTKLGAHLDPFADKVLIAVVFIIIARTFRWGWFDFFVTVILARELLITIYRMIVRMRSGSFVPASMLGKVKTTVQCVVGDSILFFLFIYPARIPERNWIIFTLMAATMFITVDSGSRYILPRCSDGKKRSLLERFLQWAFGTRAREA